MDLSLVFKQGDAILVGVFIILLLMSISSWWLILVRAVHLLRVFKANRRLQSQFWESGDLNDAMRAASDSHSPLARIARSGLESFERYRQNKARFLGHACTLDEFLVRAIRSSLVQEGARLERGLTWLATVGSVAPFVGLFGTVWGIYHALVGISTEGQVSIATVAGPIGEALVATAAGLAAAVPAVVAYNSFTRANRVLSQEMDGFAHDLHAQLLTHDGAA